MHELKKQKLFNKYLCTKLDALKLANEIWSCFALLQC